jgi:polysaccharide export outer membrane protein
MQLRSRISIWISAAVLVLLAACESTYSGPYKGFPPSEPDMSFGPGDVFDVRVYHEKELSETYKVGVDGTIDFPLIGEVKVTGKSSREVALELKNRLADGYIKNPQVSVFPKEYNSKRISVMGAVTTPGTFQFNDRMSIVEAITHAGGFTGVAKKDSVAVTRVINGEKMQRTIPVLAISAGRSPNFFVQPGDLIFVPERAF